MSDPQMGYWSYTYDLNDNLKTQTDPKSQEIEMNYDRLNRITAKIYPDDSSLNYDYDQNNLFGDQDTDYSNGKLVRVYHHVGGASTDWLIHYKYDNLGREIKRKRSFGALGAYADRITETSYDALGRETSLKYPDNETITNTYDKGALTSGGEGDVVK